MTNTQSHAGGARSYRTLAAAIVVAGVIVAAAILGTSTFRVPVTTPTKTITQTEFSTIVSTSTEYVTTTTVATTSPVSAVVASEPSTSTSCTVALQPGPFFLRIVSDANQTPVAGVRVTATSQPATVSCDGSAPLPATNQTKLAFTTNGTIEWYSLPSQNDAGYSLVISYTGRSYNFTARLSTFSETCASLYLPSGRTDVTVTEFQTTCPSTASTTTSP
jgi:hypothetical protein